MDMNETKEEIKDSTFLNFKLSIEGIIRARNTPKKKGVRGNVESEENLQTNLRNDVISIMTNPLSQISKLDPVSGLASDQVQALRALYAMVKNKTNLDGKLETAVKTTVKLLNPNFNYNMNEKVVEDQKDDNELTTDSSMPVRRSTRIAQLPQTSYHEDADDMLSIAGVEDGSDGEEAFNMAEDYENDWDEDVDGQDEVMDDV
ncbi:uncharacterized protein BP5553_04250 [Venustampulla echinocandica]|uniref:Uncharacterized protein n=1 Tax=Venustampulla echinocandica TaxID=2656787 RepID=A0A370TWK4_9HELO|nr:uncharacterized protein BP5553_04250 [Venustampulla echinocandica]RDL39910.1 hypothetical protein BP5553_04250 [Venustampulla echinocandica]